MTARLPFTCAIREAWLIGFDGTVSERKRDHVRQPGCLIPARRLNIYAFQPRCRPPLMPLTVCGLATIFSCSGDQDKTRMPGHPEQRTTSTTGLAFDDAYQCEYRFMSCRSLPPFIA